MSATTLLFTDIEGSTRLLRELGPGYADALSEHRRVLRETFGGHGGEEVDTQGDAFFYAFTEPGRAVAAASAAQAALAAGPITVRMGIHTGAPERTDEGFVGLDVHLGARVAASAHGGQVVLTKATRDLLEGVAARDLGEHRVKDFDEPVWIYQLGDEPFPPLKTISNTNLPHPASSFVGRGREVAEVEALVRGSRLVTLTGPGGSGKTRLSIEAASGLVGDFRNGVFWVGLAGVHDPSVVLPTVAQAIGGQGDLTGHIGERETLLLLDNLEQVIDVAPELAALVEACPNLYLLVTSRELLRVRGEVEYEVLPLAVPDAVELFTARARVEQSPAIEELCRRLDNMPLALELAAARTKLLTPEQILERLGERLDFFKGGRDAERRQQTLRATIEWSHDLLSEEERRLFARLGVFTGGSTIEAAKIVCDADLDTVQSLIEKSLLRRTDDRFWMLETIREYAVERLQAGTDGDAVRRRSAVFFRDVAESAGVCVEAIEAGRPHRMQLALAEQSNLRESLDWALENDPVLGLEIAANLEQFWVTQNPFEGKRRFADLLGRADSAPPLLRARALRAFGGSCTFAGDMDRALAAAEEALVLYRAAGDENGETTMLFRLGTVFLNVREFDRARPLLEESLAAFRRLGNRMGECEAAGNLASLELLAGDGELGRRLLEENVALAHEIGFTWWEAVKLHHLAEYALQTGDVDEGERRAAQALELDTALRDRSGRIFILGCFAWAAAARGEAVRAGSIWGAIESEEARGGPVGGGWEDQRAEYEAPLASVAGPAFEQGRAEGAGLSIDDAVAWALTGRNEPTAAS